jgi:hypothetical protein
MRTTKENISIEELRTWIYYDPEAGSFTWKDSGQWWHTIRDRYVGKPAGTTTLGIYGLTPYLYISISRKKYLAHRVAWALQTGQWPKHQIDHVNGDGEDNRWVNLREVTNSENHKNSPRQANNTSGVTGVSFNRSQKKWQAYIHTTGRKMVHLGFFARLEDAVRVRKEAEIAHGYHENHGRK